MNDKKMYLDSLILSVKIGNRDSFNHLKKIYTPLCDSIYDSSCKLFPILKYNRFNAFHNFYFSFWKAINNYKFDGNECFSNILSNELIKSCYFVAGREEEININKIFSDFKKKPIQEERLIALQCLKRLTWKQKQGIILFFYAGFDESEASDVLGINYYVFINRRIYHSFFRIRETIKAVKKKDRYCEKVYKIREISSKKMKEKENALQT